MIFCTWMNWLFIEYSSKLMSSWPNYIRILHLLPFQLCALLSYNNSIIVPNDLNRISIRFNHILYLCFVLHIYVNRIKVMGASHRLTEFRIWHIYYVLQKKIKLCGRQFINKSTMNIERWTEYRLVITHNSQF